MKKKRLIIALIFVACLGLGLWMYWYYLWHKKSQLASFIPAQVQTLIYFNSRNIYQHQGQKSSQSLQFFKTNPYFKNIQNPLQSGLDLLSDAAYVELPNCRYMACLISDVEKLENNIQNIDKGLMQNIVKKQAYSSCMSVKDSFILAWNQELFIYVPKAFAHQKWQEAFSYQNNFQNSSLYTETKQENADVWFYTHASQHPIIEGKTLKGFANFNGTLEVFASDKLNDTAFHQAPQFPNFPQMQVFSADASSSYINRFIHDISLLYLGSADDNILSVDFNAGQKTLFIGPQKLVEKKSISYAFDENFNQKTIVKISTDTIRMALLQSAQFTIRNCVEIDSLASKAKPVNKHIYLDFNQDALQTFFPSRLHYHVQYSCQQAKSARHYYLKIESDNWKSELKTLGF